MICKIKASTGLRQCPDGDGGHPRGATHLGRPWVGVKARTSQNVSGAYFLSEMSASNPQALPGK